MSEYDGDSKITTADILRRIRRIDAYAHILDWAENWEEPRQVWREWASADEMLWFAAIVGVDYRTVAKTTIKMILGVLEPIDVAPGRDLHLDTLRKVPRANWGHFALAWAELYRRGKAGRDRAAKLCDRARAKYNNDYDLAVAEAISYLVAYIDYHREGGRELWRAARRIQSAGFAVGRSLALYYIPDETYIGHDLWRALRELADVVRYHIPWPLVEAGIREFVICQEQTM